MAGRKAGQGSKWIRPSKRAAIYTSDGHCCAFCGKSIYSNEGLVLTLDHVVPCEHGGTNVATNLVTACLSCNSSKGATKLGKFVSILETKGLDGDTIRRNVSNARRRHAKFERHGRKAA